MFYTFPRLKQELDDAIDARGWLSVHSATSIPYWDITSSKHGRFRQCKHDGGISLDAGLFEVDPSVDRKESKPFMFTRLDPPSNHNFDVKISVSHPTKYTTKNETRGCNCITSTTSYNRLQA